ncbi:MAG: class I SAM-dependent methyltransferase [Nitrospirales bacterium]|nr:class I SAM-dependent methyltransferase [Nitrospirales bacterium]MBA3968391.1 class I SAM-dependent methyltransferase [Nitrospirales bacterium]
MKSEGMMLRQAITNIDQRYATAKRSVNFIKRYIFPGSFLLSVTAMCGSIAGVTDMPLCPLEDIGPHSATTLRTWRDTLYRNREHIRT